MIVLKRCKFLLNGRIYGQGEAIPDCASAQELVRLGLAVSVENPPKKKQSPKKSEQTPAVNGAPVVNNVASEVVPQVENGLGNPQNL